MQITKGTFTKNGVQQKTKKLYARFYDHNGIRRTLPLFPDRKNSDDAARAIQRLVNTRASGGDISMELHRFVENTLPAIRNKLASWGIVESARIASTKTLAEHLDGWDRHLRAKGNGDEYVDLKVGRTRRLFKACGFTMWNDICATPVEEKLAEWRSSKDEDMGKQTSNFYLQAVRQFCKYMVKVVKCATISPLSELTYQNVNSDRRHDRRAYTVDEFLTLLAYLRDAKTVWHIPASERALIYQFAVETGLRHGAIKRVEVRSFGSHEGTPAVRVVAGAPNKYKSERWVLLTRALWALLESHIAGKKPGDKAFMMPLRSHAAKLIRKDLEAARAKWISEAPDATQRSAREESEFLRYEDDQGRFLDFHAFRHTRGVWLFEHHNAKPREVQELLGVSSIALVDRYTKSMRYTSSAVIERGPNLAPRDNAGPKVPLAGAVGDGKSLAPSLAQREESKGSLTDSGELVVRSGETTGEGSDRQQTSENTEVLTVSGGESRMVLAPGGVAEWSIAPVLKTGGPARVP